MSSTNVLEILKSALLLEIRGKAFYQKAADEAGSEPVSDFFKQMADEEAGHIKMLSEQYSAYKKNGTFVSQTLGDMADAGVNKVMTEAFKNTVAAAGFEAAAVSAAMGMEQRAIELYSKRAGATGDPEEKKLYNWLAEWETRHLEELAEIDRQITETIWNDNNFWPF
jgi:rubrerythrin